MSLTILLAALASTQASGQAAEGLGGQLRAQLAKLPADAQVGLVVTDLAVGQPCFVWQPDRPLRPASVMKLLVTAAALDHFGPDFAFKTRMFRQGQELWVVGSGDPGLGDARLAERHGRRPDHIFNDLAAALKTAGCDRLDKIVLDDGIFEPLGRHPDWPSDQAASWYQAPVGGLNYNDNCLDARVSVQNHTVRLILEPDLPADFVINTLAIGRQHRPRVQRDEDADVFRFVGTVARNDQLGPVSVRRPAVFFGYALKQGLLKRGISVDGPVVRRQLIPQACADARPLLEHRTPLPDVLWRCNTFSQNLFAECLLKSLAAYDQDGSPTGEPGSWEAGVLVLRRTLTGLGIDLSGAVLRDGSGLSHVNRLTAAQVARVLEVMHRHRWASMFRESLARPGEEGSMRRRYGDAVLRGRLRGKTGTLAGVRSLAGYVLRPDGRELAFALLSEGPVPPEFPIRVAHILVQAPLDE